MANPIMEGHCLRDAISTSPNPGFPCSPFKQISSLIWLASRRRGRIWWHVRLRTDLMRVSAKRRHGCVQSYGFAREIDGLREAHARLDHQIDDPSRFGIEVIKHAICQDVLLGERGCKGETLIVLSSSDAHALKNCWNVQLLALIDG